MDTVNRKISKGACCGALLIGLMSGCATTGGDGDSGWNNKAKGAAIGAAVGVVTGLITGDDATERRQHAMVGAGIGALAGTAVGAYMDAQQNKLNKGSKYKGSMLPIGKGQLPRRLFTDGDVIKRATVNKLHTTSTQRVSAIKVNKPL